MCYTSCTQPDGSDGQHGGQQAMGRDAGGRITHFNGVSSRYLADAIEGVGGNSTDGSTRTKVVQQREGLRHKLLVRALAAHPHQDARPVTVYQNVSNDKCAGSWLLAIPNRDNSLSTPVFREAISAHLCLSSPVLREGGWVGRQVGTRGVVIDKF